MRIHIGLVHPSVVWEEYLRQEGVPFSIAETGGVLTPDRFSVVIVNRFLSGEEAEGLEKYVRDGGAILGYSRFLGGLPSIQSRPVEMEYIVGEGKPPFEALALLDLAMVGEISREAKFLRTEQNAHALGVVERGRGIIALVPFDPAEALGDQRAVVKNFYSRVERLPAEKVSLVAKGEIGRLLHSLLQHIHVSRGIPYAHLWYFPEKSTSIFAFRVDTDFASKEDIEGLYDMGRAHATGLTWFVDVRSHQHLLTRFRAMEGQEIGVHCYDHRVDESEALNRSNFGRARTVLEEAGFRVEGFAAPYGIWNPALAKVIDQLGFSYSSEFSWSYDALPAQPALTDRSFHTLQIPIHPICIGSLRRVGYTVQQMTEYFRMIVGWKHARREPLVFYHHPSHGHTAVIEALLSAVQDRAVPRLTFSEYAHWWMGRGRITIDLIVRGETIDVEFPAEAVDLVPGVALRIVRPNGEESLAEIAPRILLDRLEWSEVPASPPPDDLRRIREFDPRRLLGDLSARMTRRFR